jgi:hypothetical protein
MACRREWLPEATAQWWQRVRDSKARSSSVASRGTFSRTLAVDWAGRR